MTNEQRALLELIKTSQFGSSEEISLDDVNMNALYEEASQQAVLGLVASIIPSKYLDKKWLDAKHQQESAYIRYCNAQDELKDVLDKADIPFVILKGCAATIYYKNPMYRSMGDIDFLVPQDRYEKAIIVLKEAKYSIGNETERHISFHKGNYCFELHHHFSHDIDIEDCLFEGLKERIINSIDGHSFTMLPKLSNGLVLLDHMRAHLKSALGLRQVIDWMMYVYCNLDDNFWKNEFLSIAHEKGVDTLAITATRMCQIYLGLPDTITWCKSADEVLCNQFLVSLLVSGNFGRKNGNGNSVETVTTEIKQYGLFHWLQIAGEHNWVAYHKHHWLKPLCWVYQMFRYTLQFTKARRINKEIKKDFERSNARYELLKKLNII